MTTPDWTEAACAGQGSDLWFPSSTGKPGRRGDAWDAPRAICQPCPIRDACLTWALETGQVDGMWGGLDERQRAKIRAHAPRQPKDIQHGTPGGHRTHLGRGEQSCGPCTAAARAANARYQQRKTAKRRMERATA